MKNLTNLSDKKFNDNNKKNLLLFNELQKIKQDILNGNNFYFNNAEISYNIGTCNFTVIFYYSQINNSKYQFSTFLSALEFIFDL